MAAPASEVNNPLAGTGTRPAPSMDSFSSQPAPVDSDYSNLFNPRRRTSRADIQAKNQAALEALGQPIGQEEFFQVWSQAMKEDKDTAFARVRAAALSLPDELRAQLPEEIAGRGVPLNEQWAYLQRHEKTKDILMQPGFAKIFGPRVKELGTLETVWYNLPFVAAYLGAKRGHQNLRHGREAVWNLTNFDDPKFQADMARRAAEMAEDQAFLESLEYNSWGIANLGRDFFVNFGDTVGGMGSAALTPEALTAAGIGAGIGAVTGPGALATGASGLLTGVSGVQAAAAGGSAAWEHYQAQAEQMKDDRLAIQTAVFTALPSFLLERIGAGFMFKGAGPALRKMTDRVMHSAAPKAAEKISQVMASRTYQGVMARFAANAAGHTIPEVVTEGLQEGPVEIGARMLTANLYNQIHGYQGHSMPVPTAEDMVKGALAGAWQAAWGGSGIGLVSPGFEALADAVETAAHLDKAKQETDALKNMSPEQQEALADYAAQTAEKVVHLEAVRRDNENLRGNLKTAVVTLRQIPEAGEAPEAATHILKQFGEKAAYIAAEEVDRYFQAALEERTIVDPDSIQADFLDHLGVSEEQYFEALENNADLELDLTGLPHVLDHPLWDSVAESLTVEPLSVTREMEAALAEMGPPPVILPKANAMVRPEVRADLETRLVAAGRTPAQARREAEVATRQAGTLARIMGVDVNEELGRWGFAREADLRATGDRALFQPSVEEVRSADAALARDAAAWGQSVDSFLDGTLSQRHQPTMLNQTPLVLQMLGAENLPVTATYGLLQKVLVDKHRLPAETIKQVPAAMADPIMVFKSATKTGDLVMMLGLKDQDGATVVVPISLESQGKTGYAVNAVKSIYSKKNEDTLRPNNYWFANQIADGNLLYHNNKKSREWQQSSGLQLPGVGALTHGKNRIYHEADLVKLREANPTLYQSAENRPRGWTDFFSDGGARIVFTEAADASTAMHEFQHVFINEALRVLALPPDKIADAEARDRLAADLKTLEDYAGVTDGLWTREAHERVAEAFEVYMMEGRAPVQGLKGLFSQMKQWLLKIYEGLKQLQTPMTDDVRRVFDRQLASEEELLVEGWRTEPAFDAAELEGLREADPALVAEYEAALEKAVQADAEEATRFRNAEREKYVRQWKREGLEEARRDPRQVRLAEIRKAGGISRKSLEASGYDAETIRNLQRRYPGLVRNKSRVGVDEMGERYGFEVGDDFVQDIVNTPTIGELADRYVADRLAEFEPYFESDSPMTEARMDAWELELKLWGRFMGEEGSKNQRASWRDIRKVIEQKVGLKTVDEIAAQNMADLKSGLRLRERESRQAFRAGEKAGEKAGALEARLRLAAHYQVMAERRRNIDQTVAHWKQLVKAKPGTMYNPAGVRPDFQAQIVNLLNTMAFTDRKMTADRSLADFVAGLHADGVPVAVAEWIQTGQIPEWENGSRAGIRKTYRSLSYDQFLDLKFAVQNLEFLGKRQQKVAVEGRLVDEDTAARDLLASIGARHEIATPPGHGEILASDGPKSVLRRVGEGLSGYISSLIKTETMARRLDGGAIDGLAQKLIYKPVNAAYLKGMALVEELINTKLKGVVEATVGAKNLLKWRAEKVAIEGLKYALTTEQRIIYALNCGNPQNLKALRNYQLGENGEKLTDAQHQAVLDSLTKEQWDFVQAVWDFMDNDMFPRLDELTMKTMGIPLRKVEAAKVMTKYGELRGGYFPLSFDRRMSERADRQAETGDALKTGQNLYSQPNTRSGGTIERVGTTYKDLVPKLSFDVLTRSLNDNIHDLTHREAINDVWRIIRRPDVREAVEGVLGENYWVQMKRWLQEVAKPEQVGDAGGRSLLRKVRSNISVAAMGLKVSVMLCQVTGLTQSVHKLGSYWTAVGIKEFYKNPMAAARMIY